VSRGTKWRTFKGKRQFNIRAFTYGELLKIDNPKMLKTAGELTATECYDCPNFVSCYPGDWQECEKLNELDYSSDLCYDD